MTLDRLRFQLGNRWIGEGYPTYIIAELSANHRQSYDEAEALLRAAKNAGADAVKVQTYTPDTLTIDVNTPPFQISSGSTWSGKTLYELYEEAYMPWEWQPKLKLLAHELGLDFFSTAYDKTAVDFLQNLDVPIYKIASFEIVDLPLIRYIAGIGKPVILSTGMATREEIKEAIGAFRELSDAPIVLLKCTSAYPAPPEEMNLIMIPQLRKTFNCVVGLSDHTLGIPVPAGAVALGASMIEKHLTLSRDNESPDSSFSLEPEEYKAMVESIRIVEKAVGQVAHTIGRHEEQNSQFRRSLFVVEDIKADEVFTEDNIRSIRPSHGLHPRHLDDVLGRRAAKDICKGTPLAWELVV
jgi:pseudaminic acid synthase